LKFDALSQSRLYLQNVLSMTQEQEPKRTAEDAGHLVRMYSAVLLTYDEAKDKDMLLSLLPEEVMRAIQRLVTKRVELREFSPEE